MIKVICSYCFNQLYSSIPVAHAPLFTKQRVSIIVDAHLLAEIDKLTDNRSAAFEEALRLWRPENWGAVETVLPESQSRYSEEEEAQFAQEQMEETLEAEGSQWHSNT